MNGTTWLDRTNYFETLPSHQLELALWLEADRLATLLDALSQENLDNQREVVKNEKRWSYDNRPYGIVEREAPGPPLPARAPVPPPDDRLDGGPRRRLARGRPATSSGPTTRRTTRSSRSSATAMTAAGPDLGRAVLRGDPGQPRHPAARRPVAAVDARRGASGDGLRPRAAAAGLHRVPGARSTATPGSMRSTSRARSWPAARAAASTIASFGTSGSPRTSPSSRSASSAAHRSWRAGRRSRPGVDVERVETAFHEELDRIAREPVTDDELGRAKALVETEELGALQRVEERADRLSMFATLFDDPDLINRMLGRYLAVTAEGIRDAAVGRAPGRQPGGRDVPARGSVSGGSGVSDGVARRSTGRRP